jgi:aminoglycoside 6'-N-acetyltransferase I
MHIRQLRAEDKSEWLRLQRLLFPGEPGLAGEWADRLAEGSVTTFVAALPDGPLAGLIEVGLRAYAEGCLSSPVAYIEAWVVDEGLRRRGVGRALMAQAERWARERGLVEMASDAQWHNALGQRAHEALGFDEVERVVCFRKAL